MDITINIPVSKTDTPFSISELRSALTEFAAQWIAKAKPHEQAQNKEFELPEEFKKLCGSISEEKIRNAAESDEKIRHIIS